MRLTSVSECIVIGWMHAIWVKAPQWCAWQKENVYKLQNLVHRYCSKCTYTHTHTHTQVPAHTSILTLQSLIYTKQAASRDLRQMKTAAWNRKHGRSIFGEKNFRGYNWMSPERACQRRRGRSFHVQWKVPQCWSCQSGRAHYLCCACHTCCAHLWPEQVVILAVFTYDPSKLSYLLCSPMTWASCHTCCVHLWPKQECQNFGKSCRQKNINTDCQDNHFIQ